jgi:hypothetical protein
MTEAKLHMSDKMHPADFYKYIKLKNLKPSSNDDIIISHYLYYQENNAKKGIFTGKTKLVFFSEDRSALSRAKSRGLEVAKIFSETPDGISV